MNRQRQVFLTQLSGRDKDPHKRVGLESTAELMGGISDQGYQNKNI